MAIIAEENEGGHVILKRIVVINKTFMARDLRGVQKISASISQDNAITGEGF